MLIAHTPRRFTSAAAVLGLLAMLASPAIARAKCRCEPAEAATLPSCCVAYADITVADNCSPFHECPCEASQDTLSLAAISTEEARSPTDHFILLAWESPLHPFDARLSTSVLAMSEYLSSIDAQDECARLCRWLK